jgi:hypothetical protein
MQFWNGAVCLTSVVVYVYPVPGMGAISDFLILLPRWRLCLSSSWNGSCVPGMGAISDFLILLPRWRLCLSSSGMELWFLEWELFLIFYLLVTRWLSVFLTAWLLLL